MEQTKVPDWQTQVMAEALGFVEDVQMSFNYKLHKSLDHLPKKDHDHKKIQLDIFINTVVGIAPMIISHYANDSESMENYVIDVMKAKFKFIRDAKAADGKPKLELV